MEQFATEGLRTLVVAKKVENLIRLMLLQELGRKEFELFYKYYHDVAISFAPDKKAILERMADEIERNLVLIGCTAIEDKLQEQVPETVDYLLNAGVCIWVITGKEIYICNLRKVIEQKQRSTLVGLLT